MEPGVACVAEGILCDFKSKTHSLAASLDPLRIQLPCSSKFAARSYWQVFRTALSLQPPSPVSHACQCCQSWHLCSLQPQPHLTFSSQLARLNSQNHSPVGSLPLKPLGSLGVVCCNVQKINVLCDLYNLFIWLGSSWKD